MGMWDEILDSDNLEPYLKTKDEFKSTKWPNIQQKENGEFIAYARQNNKQIYLGTFQTIDEAVSAQVEFKHSGAKQLKYKDPLSQLPDLINHYFQTTPRGIKHSYLDSAHIECGNEIGFLINCPYISCPTPE